MKKLILVLAVIGAAAAANALSSARVAAFAPHHGPAGHLESRLERLELSDEARQAVYAILDSVRAEQRELRTAVREAHDEMRALLDEDTPEEASVLAQADVVAVAMTELRKSSLRTMLAVRQELTPEQRDELRSSFMQHDRPHGASHGRHVPGPCGRK